MTELAPFKFPEKSKLHEIADVLLNARNNAHYAVGTTHALDHLLVHVVAALQEIDARLMALEAKNG